MLKSPNEEPFSIIFDSLSEICVVEQRASKTVSARSSGSGLFSACIVEDWSRFNVQFTIPPP